MNFSEGTFLRIIFSLLCAGLLLRLTLFVVSLFSEGKVFGWSRAWSGLLRTLVPFHSGMRKNPFQSVLVYLFHLCLLVVPIWFSGHIVLWEESFLHWSWAPLPDSLADGMTIMVLLLLAAFLVRRIALKQIRQESSLCQYVMIFLTALPFLSGYLLSHRPSSGDGVWTFHVLTGSVFLLMTIFLFVRPWLNEKKCTACASCVAHCPGQALKSADGPIQRVLEFTPSCCVLCGGCVAVCPENAAGLRHALSFRSLVKRFAGERLHAAAMGRCRRCGEMFAPLSQVEEVRLKTAQESVYYCEQCKRERIAGEKLRPV